MQVEQSSPQGLWTQTPLSGGFFLSQKTDLMIVIGLQMGSLKGLHYFLNCHIDTVPLLVACGLKTEEGSDSCKMVLESKCLHKANIIY